MGFTEPSEIQAKAIPDLLEGKDVIGQAQTGTGKTAAFSIPGITKIDPEVSGTQMLVLCPTRELVVQVAGELHKLTRNQPEISALAIYGGQDISIQLKKLKQGAAQIVIGTPGRVMDHMRRKSIDFKDLKYVVFDEADQMLDMGFREDMETILAETPAVRQTVMFSATMPKGLLALMKRFQHNPSHVNTIGDSQQSSQIKQIHYHLARGTKFEAMKRLLSFHQIQSGLIFCNTKMMVDELAKEFSQLKYTTAALHGDIDQKKRNKVMQDFRDGRIQLLIATDVAARGLDVNDLEAVINYDLPRFDQDYVHRIGRTGRAGKMGLALTLVIGKELDGLSRIARKNNMQIEAGKVPTLNDLEKASFNLVKESVQKTSIHEKEYEKYFSYLHNLELKDADPAEVTALLLKVLVDQKLTGFKDVNFKPEHGGGGGGGRKEGGRNGGGGRGGYDRNRRDHKNGRPRLSAGPKYNSPKKNFIKPFAKKKRFETK